MSTFRAGERVRTNSGMTGVVAVPADNPGLQWSFRVTFGGPNEEAVYVLTEDGEVRRFLARGLTSLEPHAERTE